MNSAEFQLQGLGDPRLAVHATSPLPTWLWSIDGKRVLWANPVGAQSFGAGNGAALLGKVFGPADQHRRQIAQLAGRLPQNGAVRLERLRGFGAPPGMLATCACSRLEFADGRHAVLIAAASGAINRTMPLLERLARLVRGVDVPMAAFARDGMFVGASDAARALLGFRNLTEAGLDAAREDALRRGRVETSFRIGHMVLQRVGSGADVGLIALMMPAVAETEAAPSPPETATGPAARQPFYEQPALSGEAPAEFALFDALDTEPEEAEPSPFIEPVADEPSVPVATPLSYTTPDGRTPAGASEKTPSWHDEPLPNTRRYPLRFMWQMDREGRFSLGSDEFTRLIGVQAAAGFGRLWSDIADRFGLDPEGRVMKAFATEDTWSGITLNWPVDGGGRLRIELSGLPIFDRARNFAGYRGFGVCRDFDGLARLEALRRYEFFSGPPAQSLSADTIPAEPEPLEVREAPRPEVSSGAAPPTEPTAASATSAEVPEPKASEILQQSDLETTLDTPKDISTETPVEAPGNVLPFRPPGEPKPPSLTPVENNAFNELARQLSARLESQIAEASTPSATEELVAEAPPPPVEAHEPAFEPPSAEQPAAAAPATVAPEWLSEPEPAPRGEARRDRALLDLMPTGVLIYRLDRLLYANPAFLKRMGYESVRALEDAGGLDALYVEPGVSAASSTSDSGTPVRIAAAPPHGDAGHGSAEAHLHTISWDGDSALALIFAERHDEGAAIAAAMAAERLPPDVAPGTGLADAEELGAILDTAAEGVVMFDAEGNINSCNRSAEALFGYDGDELVQRNLADLFAPESQRVMLDYLESIKGEGVASLLDHGREGLGRVRQGGLVPLSITMGRTRADGPNFFAVFRDLSQAKKSESELREAKRLAERAAIAKADMLARISHEVRTPLNAIIGFAEVMIGERFGSLGNERYLEYMKDIRASGEHVLAIINDLLDLSRIETGKLDLALTDQNLNEMVESCVAVMQPQANRERIIIRTSLAHMLPPVLADARALRQITLNLIGNSIHLANAGGQVIVSTALSDFGEVMLRVRDTGQSLNDNEVAAALEPFRTPAPSDQTTEGSAVSLSLTKALVEANRARFHIKTGGRSGTLIEVAFPHATARA
ncbi:PAS domain S-box protein [Bradyrhizobium sp. Arg237L]|uniref:PAS domain-containing protein n=1 Tax=Bradyrhizobium sp. Arg237L TaxID=3003352 RepID=UPI00249EFE70|nr:PAS domain-containing protein [Bradyrhizobium sp. Arg237L]MDI4238520.1 PAS domain S-box protein [Bradyrhizobium sp. Arg237L]